MSLDAVIINALRAELSEELIEAKLEKINQPSNNLFILSFRNIGRELLISIDGGTSRIHLTARKYEKPSTPPMFCMLLRKHLSGAVLTEIIQNNKDRVLSFEFEKRSDFFGNSKLRLIVELTGRYANLILCDAEGRIIDAANRRSISGEGARPILPGIIYSYPIPPIKDSIFETKIVEFSNDNQNDFSEKWLINTFSGISPIVSREVFFKYSEDIIPKKSAIQFIEAIIEEKRIKPYSVFVNGNPIDFTFFEPYQYGAAAEVRGYQSFSELLDDFYYSRENKELYHKRSKELFHAVVSAKKRLMKKLGAQKIELMETENREDIRRKADLIRANIYRIKKGDRELRCQDFYNTEEYSEVRIELNPLKSPQDNADTLYKKYKKMKTANSYLTKLISENEEQLDYLDSIGYELNVAESNDDFSNIKNELIAAGILREKNKTKKEKQIKLKPQVYKSSSGLDIMVGRNNLQNDEITFKIASKYDLWFHVKDYHGSHVIIRSEGREVSEQEIKEAAALAVRFSEATSSGKAPVDYTFVKNVKKPNKSKPGFVNYFEYKSIIGNSSDFS